LLKTLLAETSLTQNALNQWDRDGAYAATFIADSFTNHFVNLNSQTFTIGELNLTGAVSGGFNFYNGTLILSETSGSASVNVSTHNSTKDFGGPNPVDVQLASDAILNTIGSDSTLKFDENASISGTGALIKQGLGTVYLDGANTYSGGTTISAGTLIANHENGSAIIDALGTGLITLNGGRLHSALGHSTLNSYLVERGTTGTISTATGTKLWLNGGAGQSFTLQGNLVIGTSDATGDVVMDVIGTNAAPASTITVAYGRLVDGNRSLGNLTGFTGAPRVAAGATIDFYAYGGGIRNLPDATPGNGGTVSWASDRLYVYGGNFSGHVWMPPFMQGFSSSGFNV